MINPEALYIIWQRSEPGLFRPSFFETAEEAIISLKDTDEWYFTKAVEISSLYVRDFEPPKPVVKEKE